MDKLNYKLKEIADYISGIKTEDIGVYTGLAGMLVFMSYYQRYSGDAKYEAVKNRLLDECCEKICNGSYYTPFCGGLVGVLYGLSHLNKYGFIDVDLTEVHEGYFNYTVSSLNQYAQKNNFDFMHGATGIALYLLNNGNEPDLKAVAEYIKILDHVAEKSNGGVKWLSEIGQEQGSAYNIALSHGMSGIAIFLAQCVKKDVEPQVSKLLLDGSVNYILKQELDYQKYGSYFPYHSIESEGDRVYKSRMAWCYGDLGVAMALWHSGNKTARNKAVEVMKFAAGRRDLESNLVVDACVCHGTAGIAQTFRRMYLYTGEDIFSAAHQYWIEETLKMAKWKDGPAGYKLWGGPSRRWENSDVFLDGIAGIGLALMASAGDASFSAWDEILLLS